MKRRRNPIDSNLLLLAVLGAGAYWLYKKVSGPPTPGGTVDQIETSIANLFPGTSPTVQLNSSVLMPDGTKFPAQNLKDLNFGFVNGQAQFQFNGSTYALTPQVNGVYQAIPI